MLFRVIQVAMFLLITWLTFQSAQTATQVNQLKKLTSSQQETLDTALISSQQASEEKLGDLGKKITAIVDAQKKNEDNAKKLQNYKAAQNKLTDLRRAYQLVLEAEVARINKDGDNAQEKLKASKTLIWKSGTNYPEHKKALQGLMQPVDITLGKWKKGDLSQDTKAIYSVISAALKKQDK